MREEIAKVEKTMLGFEDHGIMTCFLHLSFGGSGQGAGGYALDEPRRDASDKFLGRYGTSYGMEWVIRAIKACGVDTWEQIKGRTVLALREGEDRFNGKLVGLKPLPTERGETFIFADLAAEHFPEEKVA